jgi:hypothetical protein
MSIRRRRKPLLWLSLAMASVAVMAAASSASAVAATQHWASSTQVPYGASQSFSGKAESNLSLNWKVAGVNVQMSCGSVTTSGTAENPSGGGAGTLAVPSIKLGNCTVGQPTNCAIQENSITVEGKPSTATVAGSDELKYGRSPSLGTMELVGSGCGLAGSYVVEGEIGAIARPSEPGTYEFSKASSQLTIAGGSLTIQGYLGLSTSAGEALVLSSSASPGAPHWYRGSSAWSNLSTGKSSTFASNGALSFALSTKVFGTRIELSCSGTSNSVSGSVENPVGGAGTASASFSFAGCTLPKLEAKGCLLQQPWNWAPVSGAATEVGGKPALEFQLSGASAPAFHLTSAEGKSCAYAGEYPVEGELIASSDGDGIFHLSAGKSLSLFGEAASVTGTFALQRENTESLRLQP